MMPWIHLLQDHLRKFALSMKTSFLTKIILGTTMNDSAKGVCSPSSDPNEMLISRIIDHEGMEKSAYQDSLGFWTIGCGRLIDSRKNAGLSVDEIFFLLRNDLNDCRSQLTIYAWFKCQDDVRQGALIELCFNLGITHLLEFKNMLDAIGRKNYPEAVKALLNSKWAEQVSKNRVDDISYRINFGRYK
jgi:lysozyme